MVAAGLIALDGVGRMGAGVFACDPGCGGHSLDQELHHTFGHRGFPLGRADPPAPHDMARQSRACGRPVQASRNRGPVVVDSGVRGAYQWITAESEDTMIEYRHNVPLDPVDVVRVLDASGISRPTDDVARIARMYATSNLLISAWSDGVLVGVCCGMTDYSYTCYLADLAAEKSFQKQGIGR